MKPLKNATQIAAVIIAAAAAFIAHAATDAPYKTDIDAWRMKADQSLRRDNGWLTLAGRHELSPGENTVGTGKDNKIVLAPGLAPLREAWQRNELLVVHAMAIPYRTRSHFDGQAILETGLDRPAGSTDGWRSRGRSSPSCRHR